MICLSSYIPIKNHKECDSVILCFRVERRIPLNRNQRNGLKSKRFKVMIPQLTKRNNSFNTSYHCLAFQASAKPGRWPGQRLWGTHCYHYHKVPRSPWKPPKLSHDMNANRKHSFQFWEKWKLIIVWYKLCFSLNWLLLTLIFIW